MTASRSLPARPSLESLRKQAKKLARDVAAADADAIARAREHLANVELPLTQRNAQLVIAREYGFAGWQDLTAEVSKRLGRGLDWAVTQARRVIHDNDVERLRQLLAEHPALLSWKDNDDDRGLLGMATSAYGDAGDAQREQWFTRGACAELLIDAGAVVVPSVCEGLLQSRARGLLELFQRKGLLPRTLKFVAALGDLDGVRAALNENGNDLQTVNVAFVSACRFEHEAVASVLLERSTALDPELGHHIDASTDRNSFIKAFEKSDLAQVAALRLWKVFVMEQVRRTLQDRDVTAFVSALQRQPWLLGDASVAFQIELIEVASYQRDPGEFIGALLDLDPAILRRQPPPRSNAIEWAFTYANTHLLPLLTRIWPVPDDLPHAAGLGNLARVKQWFDGAGAVRNPADHYPYNDPDARSHLRWEPPTPQQVLDVALAFAVTNRHFDVADFLLEHGADINTDWNSHEPASLLHHLVFLGNYEAMQFLIDRGIDMTIKDYRWNSTARGWALYAKKDQKMADWLEGAERQRNSTQR
ncbi:MAG: ankyrin repeat domain-containing protein [Acidobacteriota bacterium]